MKEDTGNLPRILVLGIGNELCGDDGFGPAVAKEFFKLPIADLVEVENGATLGLNLAWLMEDYDVVLIPDAVFGIGSHGEISRIVWEEVLFDTSSVKLSLHELGLAQVCAISKNAGWKIPKIIIFGVQPKIADFGIKILSEEVARAVPTVVEMIAEEIRKLIF